MRFYGNGALWCQDKNRIPLYALSTDGPIVRSRELLPRVRAAVAGCDGVQLIEQTFGGWVPLTERTLARFEGRDVVGDPARVVERL